MQVFSSRFQTLVDELLQPARDRRRTGFLERLTGSLVQCLREIVDTDDATVTVDDRLLEIAGKEIHWLVLVIALRILTPRLVFLSAEIKVILGDIYYILAVILLLRITWHTINFAEKV